MEEKIKKKITKIYSAIYDFDAKVVEVESSFVRALPSFSIVGLANNAIQESKDRIKSALITNGYTFPPLKIVINLSPSNIKKTGTHFDLPIALSILFNDKDIDFSEYLILGELGLDGSIKDTNTIFPIVLSLQNKFKKIITSKESAKKLSKIPGIKIYAYDNIGEIDFDNLVEYKVNEEFDFKYIEIDGKKYYYDDNFELDFKDVKGQILAKRAALIAVSGMHNILLEGSAGVGKSMIISRMKYIMPPLSLEELLEIQKILSYEKEIDFRPIRPFRMPHHSSTKAAIFGGGSSVSKIGELGLAHGGILFFDELPYFNKDVLENLRLPLQEGKVLISRVNSKIEYKTSFLFASAMNPCPCGNLLSKNKNCRCSDIEIKRYKNRLSEPLLDRIDLYVQMSESDSDDVISSKEMFEKMLVAFKKQVKRGFFNGKMKDEDISRYCVLDDESENIFKRAINNYSLSYRAQNKLLKVARTIADLDDSEKITKKHLLEALQFRKR